MSGLAQGLIAACYAVTYSHHQVERGRSWNMHENSLANKSARTTRVGLVDDDISVRRGISRLLQAHGYACVSYESGEAALADPQLLRMECLVIDIQLVGIDGFELWQRIEALGSHIPHFFISAHVEPDGGDVADRLGGSILLMKPFDEHQLVASIERVISDQH
jgi:FixJ family two-component response regulator